VKLGSVIKQLKTTSIALVFSTLFFFAFYKEKESGEKRKRKKGLSNTCTSTALMKFSPSTRTYLVLPPKAWHR
jgi:hypothetical protein